VDVSDLLRDLGGVARRSALLGVFARADIERALAGQPIVRDARGLYALPDADLARRLRAPDGCRTRAARDDRQCGPWTGLSSGTTCL
jgi:hypothetical protein